MEYIRQTGMVLVLALVLSCVTNTAASDRFTVRHGHTGAVRDIAYHPEHNLAFTVGDDGKLLVWDLSLPGLRRQMQIAVNPVTRIAHHPTRNQVTFYVRDAQTSGRLIAWDLDDDVILFSRPMQSEPVFMTYSPGGTFVVYAASAFESLFFIGSQAGDERPYLRHGFGIVTFVQIARSERNVMTYVPSRGEFIYWELSSGRELQTIRSRSRLQHLTSIDPTSQRLLAGADGEALVIVDNLTGSVEASYPVSPIRGIAYSEQSDTMLVLTEQFGRPTTLAFQYRNGRLARAFYQPQNLHAATSLISPAPSRVGGFIAGSTDGTVSFYASNNGRLTTLGSPAETRINFAALSEGRLYLTAGSEIISFQSDVLRRPTLPTDTIEFTSISVDRRRFDQLGSISVTSHADTLYVWGAAQAGVVYTYDPTRRTMNEVYRDPSGSGVQSVRADEHGLLVVHRDGRIVLSVDGQVAFTYTSTSVQDALWDPRTGLVIARAPSRALDTPVMIVDPRTRETVAVDAPGFVAQRLALDPESGTVYAVVLSGSPAQPISRLVRIDNRGLARARTLLELAGSPVGSDLSWDAATGAVFTTLTGKILSFGREERSFDEIPRLHTSVSVSHLVAATNADGTVSVWNRADGSHLADITVLPDGWLLTGSAGFLSSGSRAERLLGFYTGRETGAPSELADLRIELPLSIRPNL